MFRTVIGAAVAAAALGKIQWTPNNIEELKARRLALNLATSTSNITDPECIVGGFDDANPSKIYIGGPCNELTVTLNANGDVQSATTKPGFRWVEMESVHMEIVGKAGGDPAPFKPNSGSQFVIAKDVTTHAEVALASTFHLDVPGAKNTNLFASTTSYLSKATFKFSKNNFCVMANDPKDGNCAGALLQCAVPCCASPPCTCTACPAEANGVQAVPGMYKYSIMAGAFNAADMGGTAFVAGAAGNGWEKVVESYGEGTPKALKGNMDWFQTIDFTNMKADALKVIAPDGSFKMFKDMTACTLKNGTSCATNAVALKEVEVESDGWTAAYVFPTTSNVGDWTMNMATKVGSTTASATRVVSIHAVRPDVASLISIGVNANDAPNKKMVLLRYRFNIDGITAESASKGKFMNYDPSVAAKGSAAHTAAKGGSAAATATTGGAATGGGTTGGATGGSTGSTTGGNTTGGNATTTTAAPASGTASGAMPVAMPAGATGFLALMAATIRV